MNLQLQIPSAVKLICCSGSFVYQTRCSTHSFNDFPGRAECFTVSALKKPLKSLMTCKASIGIKMCHIGIQITSAARQMVIATLITASPDSFIVVSVDALINTIARRKRCALLVLLSKLVSEIFESMQPNIEVRRNKIMFVV